MSTHPPIHLFGDLLRNHLQRKPGLTQAKLAAGILQEPAMITRMIKGKRLTGPQARERVFQIIGWLYTQGALSRRDEADALLIAAGLAPLNVENSAEAKFATSLQIAATSNSDQKVIPRRKHNLPTPTTPLFGRDGHMLAASELLRHVDVRLMTLLGPPGVGKTRLALQVAQVATGYFADGSWFVPLSSITDPQLIASAINQALENNSTELSQLESLKRYLNDKNLLLLLDNVEQLLGKDETELEIDQLCDSQDSSSANAALIIAEILAVAPQVKVLTTSRVALRINGEHRFEVPPLEPLAAIELFTNRAHALGSKFSLNDTNVRAISDLCERLDRLPLAIELAAAYVNVLSVEDISNKLDRRFAFLRRGVKDAPNRHQTLQSAIEWSYNLLSEAEQRLFRVASVCVSNFSFGALESIYSVKGESAHIIDLFTSLVEKNLVIRLPQSTAGLRFMQLETIREFGLLKLTEANELEAVKQSHTLFFLAFAETAEPMLHGKRQISGLAHFDEEHSNLRAALKWTVDTGQAAIASRFGKALWHFWYIRWHHQEGMKWLALILDLPVSKEARAHLLYGLGMLARRAEAHDIVKLRLTEALELFREIEDIDGIASVLRVLGFTEYLHGQLDLAQQKLSEAFVLFEQLNNEGGQAATLSNLAGVHMNRQDLATARACQERSLALRRKIGSPHGIAVSLDNLALIAIRQRDLEFARSTISESYQFYAELDSHLPDVTPTALSALVSCAAGEFNEAFSLYEKLYNEAKQRQDNTFIARVEIALVLVGLHSHRNTQDEFTLLYHALNHLHVNDDLESTALGLAAFCLLAFAKGYISSGLQVAAQCVRLKAQRDRNALFWIYFPEIEAEIVAARKVLDQDDAIAIWAEGDAMTPHASLAYSLDLCKRYKSNV